MYVHDQFASNSNGDIGGFNHGYTQMYHFGDGENAHIVFAGNTLLPYTEPTLQFPAPLEMPEEESPQQHLFYSFIAAELNASGVNFGGQLHPFMNEVVADEYDQPLLASPNAEPELVPVYPRQSPVVFNPLPPGPPQSWSSNPFGGVEPRPAPTLARRPPRILLPKGTSVPRAAPVDAFDGGDLIPSRGRKRALSPDARAAAREVRIMHACGRCHKKRAKCGTTRPCEPCLGKYKRSLDLPCMPELPEDRWKRLFTGRYLYGSTSDGNLTALTEAMYGHLELSQIQEEMPPADTTRQPFKIRLHQYFDDPELVIPVVPFVPQTPFHIKKSIFPIGQNNTGLVMQQTEIISPPLVPAFNSSDDSYPLFLKKFYWSVRRWLDQAEIHDDIQWNQIFFREAYGKAWPRAIFGDVCQFYHRVTKSGCPVLKSCLQTTVLVYMIGHSFYVPDEDVETVMEKTFGSSYSGEKTEWVSPIYVDRFVKTLLLPVYKAGVKASLRGLQSLYSLPKPSAFKRDRILATSIVLLIVAASQQGKAIEKALARDRQGYKVNTDDVFTQIRDIEHHIIDLVMDLWVYKFPADARMGSDNPEDRFSSDRAREYNLLERFRQSFDASDDVETLRDLPTELPRNLDSKKFGIFNTERVLKKFYLVVFPEEK